MKHAYSRTRAKQLIPLLRSIAVEIDERTLAVRRLERALRSKSEAQDGIDVLQTRAQLAEQRLELRLARRELQILGCAPDESMPHRVLIPGAGGEISNGFRWDLGDTNVYRLGEEPTQSAA